MNFKSKISLSIFLGLIISTGVQAASCKKVTRPTPQCDDVSQALSSSGNPYIYVNKNIESCDGGGSIKLPGLNPIKPSSVISGMTGAALSSSLCNVLSEVTRDTVNNVNSKIKSETDGMLDQIDQATSDGLKKVNNATSTVSTITDIAQGAYDFTNSMSEQQRLRQELEVLRARDAAEASKQVQ